MGGESAEVHARQKANAPYIPRAAIKTWIVCWSGMTWRISPCTGRSKADERSVREQNANAEVCLMTAIDATPILDCSPTWMRYERLQDIENGDEERKNAPIYNGTVILKRTRLRVNKDMAW